MKTAIWTQVSTNRRETADQAAQLQAEARRRGWQTVQMYRASPMAWRGGHKAALKRLVDEARRGRFQTLLLWSLDHLSGGRPLEALDVVERLGRAGVQVVSLQEPWTETAAESGALMMEVARWLARQAPEIEGAGWRDSAPVEEGPMFEDAAVEVG